MSAAFDFSALSPPFLRNLVDPHIFPPIPEWTDSSMTRAEQLYTKNLAQVRDTLKESEKQSSHVMNWPRRSMLTQAIIHLHRSVFEMKWNHHHHRYLRMQFPLTTQGFIQFVCLFKVEFEPQAHSVSQRCWTWCVQRRGWWDVGSLMLFTKIRSDSIEYTYTTVQVIYCHCRPSSEVLARLP